MSKSGYTKIKNAKGIYKYQKTGNFLAMKKINGKQFQNTFSSLYEAKLWQKTFNGSTSKLDAEESNSNYSTLKEVWEEMQKSHFPTLATNTKVIWMRRYELLKTLEHLPMDKITPSKMSAWVTQNVEFFKSEEYQTSGRGRAKRCNLNNELNLFVTIFNWPNYKFLVQQLLPS